jgi:hypothetical protein
MSSRYSCIPELIISSMWCILVLILKRLIFFCAELLNPIGFPDKVIRDCSALIKQANIDLGNSLSILKNSAIFEGFPYFFYTYHMHY